MNAFQLISRAALVGLFSLSSPLFGFGGPGHSFVGAVADARLAKTSPDTRKQVKSLLDDLPLDQAALIPDQIRSWDMLSAAEKAVPNASDLKSKIGVSVGAAWSPELRQQVWEYFQKNLVRIDGQPRHHVYHFTDIAVVDGAALAYDFNGKAVGQNGDDIVHTLARCFGVLRERTPDANRGITEPMAVILIAHLVGDLHQPLHVGAQYFSKNAPLVAVNPNGLAKDQFLEDRGGNSIGVPYAAVDDPGTRHRERVIDGAKSDNLHSLWDKDAVSAAFDELNVPPQFQGSAFLTQLVAKAPKTKWIPAQGDTPAVFFSQWATEILPVAREAHDRLKLEFAVQTDKKGSTHNVIQVAASAGDDDYLAWAGESLSVSMVKGGYRLAWVLDQALKKAATHKPAE